MKERLNEKTGSKIVTLLILNGKLGQTTYNNVANLMSSLNRYNINCGTNYVQSITPLLRLYRTRTRVRLIYAHYTYRYVYTTTDLPMY